MKLVKFKEVNLDDPFFDSLKAVFITIEQPKLIRNIRV